MDTLYYFNPDNDLALAANRPHYTPPAVAVEFGRSAACLPLWYSGQGDYVLAQDWDNEWLQWIQEKFDLPSTVVNTTPETVRRVAPWGWSSHACETLDRHGVKSEILPSVDTLERYRRLSHRRSVIAMFRSLAGMELPYPLPQIPLEVTTDVVMAQLISNGYRLFVKSPWSGSGRGVIDTATAPDRQVLRLASGVIKRQGSVLVERGLDKVLDFAMLYEMKNGIATYVGLSVFNNVNYSTYGGNILDSEQNLLGILLNYVPIEAVEATRVSVGKALQEIIGKGYEGPVGVDMLVYREGDKFLIDPCVEVNLRMTMGRVAHAFASQYLSYGVSGQMVMTRCPMGLNLPMNAVVKDGRLVSGVVSLTSPCAGGIGITCQVTQDGGKGHGAVIP